MSCFFFFSSRRRHTRFKCDWSSDVCSSDLNLRFTRLSTYKLSPLGDEILRVRSTMKTLYAPPLLAAILAVTLVGGPISPAFGQDAPQTPQAAPAKPAAPIIPVSLASAKYD